ncbi:hypothetical protein RhiXN_01480 [Rhizoctonia solani]|uniref:Uncharacterized protein n=1 Tax=Rhizoctonia solani TaxID=456999 RepID=A0A8H8P809_9AGAM|nr:uncharacterized protein RhiXN_01480 [Rhizoctonia solani]QRW26885.1 hypothetical protein RhiXN_01480 [Rhizoctonia solani]
MTEVTIKLDVEDVPELGTRPICFPRRKLSADTSSRQFWGFSSFNQDRLGPIGFALRYSEPNQRGCIISESLFPDLPDYKQSSIELQTSIQFVNIDRAESIPMKWSGQTESQAMNKDIQFLFWHYLGRHELTGIKQLYHLLDFVVHPAAPL